MWEALTKKKNKKSKHKEINTTSVQSVTKIKQPRRVAVKPVLKTVDMKGKPGCSMGTKETTFDTAPRSARVQCIETDSHRYKAKTDEGKGVFNI